MLNLMRDTIRFDFGFAIRTGVQSGFVKAIQANAGVDINAIKQTAETKLTSIMELYNK
ncbi:MAG: hypothetical protein IJY42_03545 [Clostridia bacterium]|nr:hypothetical protein [Clostridia bacterium]